MDAPGIADFAGHRLQELGGNQLLAVSPRVLEISVVMLTDLFSDLTVDCLAIVTSNM
jgi:hypothetical protein